MTTAPATLPIGQGRQGQILDQLRAGPKTADELAKVLFPRWAASNPSGAGERLKDVLEQMSQVGQIHEVEGVYEMVPESEDPESDTGDKPDADGDDDKDWPNTEDLDGDNGAVPTAGPADNHDTEKPNVAKRGRKPGTKNQPKAAATNAAEVKTQKTLPPDGEEIAGHLGAIERVENELAEAKIGYEDCLNVRRLKKAALDVAKSERRRYSVHEGSNLAQIKQAQKNVDKAQKQYNEAAANALESKNRVDSVEEKLARTIAGGEMPLFGEGEDDGGGDDE